MFLHIFPLLLFSCSTYTFNPRGFFFTYAVDALHIPISQNQSSLELAFSILDSDKAISASLSHMQKPDPRGDQAVQAGMPSAKCEKL